jgi:uncharacterized protein (DUF2147 family)
MRHALVGLMLLLLPASGFAAPSPDGMWMTQDGDGIISIQPCDGKLCARIDGFMLDHPDDRSPVDYRGVSQCHLPLISDAEQVEPNLWKGHITDPRNGNVYRVELHVESDGTLALRGYIGIPLLGQTQTWTRYDGTVPEDCRITKPEGGDVVSR